MTLNYSSTFPQRVENVQGASQKYATIFQCYFGNRHTNFRRVEMTCITPPPE